MRHEGKKTSGNPGNISDKKEKQQHRGWVEQRFVGEKKSFLREENDETSRIVPKNPNVISSTTSFSNRSPFSSFAAADDPVAVTDDPVAVTDELVDVADEPVDVADERPKLLKAAVHITALQEDAAKNSLDQWKAEDYFKNSLGRMEEEHDADNSLKRIEVNPESMFLQKQEQKQEQEQEEEEQEEQEPDFPQEQERSDFSTPVPAPRFLVAASKNMVEIEYDHRLFKKASEMQRSPDQKEKADPSLLGKPAMLNSS